MKFLKIFVSEYKAIFDRSYTVTVSKKDKVIKTLSLTFIMAVIAFITYLLFNKTVNLGFLFIILNGIILGSFIIYKTLLAIDVRVNLGEEYSIRSILLVECLELVIIVTLTSTFIIMIFFLNYVSYFVMMLFIFIFVSSSILYIEIQKMLLKEDIEMTRYLDFVYSALYLSTLFYLITTYISFMSIASGMILTTFILSLVYVYKIYTYQLLKSIYARKVYAISGLLLLWLMLATYGEQYNVIRPFEIFSLRYEKVEINKELIGNEYIMRENDIVTLHNNEIVVYDYEFKVLFRIETNSLDMIQIGEDIYFSKKLEVSLTNSDLALYEIYRLEHEEIVYLEDVVLDKYTGDFYQVQDEYAFVESSTLLYVDNDEVTQFSKNDDYKDQLLLDLRSNYLIFNANEYTYLLSANSSESYYTQVFEDNTILPEENVDVYYNNGAILVIDKREADEKMYYNQIDYYSDLFSNSYDFEFKIPENFYIHSFYNSEDYIYICMTTFLSYDVDSFTFVYDKEGNNVLAFASSKNTQVYENKLISIEDDSYYLYTMNEDMKMMFSKTSEVVKMISPYFFFIMVFGLMPLPIRKESE